jgi:hypothetical protein
MDQFNIIVGLAVLFLIGFVVIIALLRQVHQLEALVEEKTVSVKYYSRESLNRYDEISKLKMELATLKLDKGKLQDEILAQKEVIKVFSETVENLANQLTESGVWSNPETVEEAPVESVAEVAEVVEVAEEAVPTVPAEPAVEITETVEVPEVKEEPVVAPIASVSTPTNKSKNKNRRKK